MADLNGSIAAGSGKCCAVCGVDVTAIKRVKDPRGKYYCAACYERGTQTKAPEVTPASRDRSAIAPPPSAPSVHAAASVRVSSAGSEAMSRVRSKLSCPHCWHNFAPEQILWVSQHTELRGDAILGRDAAARFLPTRFNIEGNALDARGMACQILACPRCHLTVARCLVENEPLFVSIIGVPASGKSYFLTAMTWQLRQQLSQRFGLTFNDADTICNQNLNGYEEVLFLQSDPDHLVAIRKTDIAGADLYDEVRFGEQVVSLPKPYLFSLRPGNGHPNRLISDRVGRVLCVYDNAGEHFRPGEDSASTPVTQHLAKSRVLMFLYDPTKDPRFRERCKAFSDDPQLSGTSRTERQETILTEAAQRVRRYTGLAQTKKHDRPLIVIIPKADVWEKLLEADLSSEPILENGAGNGIDAVDIQRIEMVSAKLRRLLMQLTPEFVAAAEDFCEHVVYVPISVFRQAPQTKGDGFLYTRASDVKPRWVTVPILYMFAKWSGGLIVGNNAPPATVPQAKVRTDRPAAVNGRPGATTAVTT